MTDEELPDRRKHGYADLEKQVEDHTKEVEDRLHKFFTKALATFALLGFISAGSLLGFGVVLQTQADVSRKIQEQRFDAFRLNCEQTNDRYFAVISAINKAIAATPPKQRAQAEKSAVPFKAILAAAVPFTPDCYGYARDRVKGTS